MTLSCAKSQACDPEEGLPISVVSAGWRVAEPAQPPQPPERCWTGPGAARSALLLPGGLAGTVCTDLKLACDPGGASTAVSRPHPPDT